jgi:hypothetical protein
MMDREKQNELPSLEVGFLVGICLPCYELLANILPQTRPMVEGANANLKRWKEMADEQKELEEKRRKAAIEHGKDINTKSIKSEQTETTKENNESKVKNEENTSNIDGNQDTSLSKPHEKEDKEEISDEADDTDDKSELTENNTKGTNDDSKENNNGEVEPDQSKCGEDASDEVLDPEHDTRLMEVM